jgi:peptidoglycan/LPS O-acetylase OafA/YrhL
MTAPRLAFLDWMKAVGMFLIVVGHVVGGPVNLVTPPIYVKQLGVTLFMFVSGFTLARERRPTWRVVVNRLFEIVLITAVAAVLSTIVSLAGGGRGHLTNYLPLLFGANLLLGDFPANPTTWYVGTYIHLIVLWALTRQALRPTPALLGLALVAEVLVRAALWSRFGAFPAYMALTNWMTVFLLGIHAGRRGDGVPAPRWTAIAAGVAVALPLAAGAVWTFATTFPFRALPAAGTWSPLVSSVGISLIYTGATWLGYLGSSTLGQSAVVQFLAAQTVFIFVAHMPAYYGMFRLVGAWPRWERAAPLVLVCYFGLALLGAMVYRWFRPLEWREALVRRVAPAFGLPDAVKPARE